jgi:hypothetical protein
MYQCTYIQFPRKDHMYLRCSHTGRTHSNVSLHLISFDFHLVMRDAHSYRSGILYGQDGKHPQNAINTWHGARSGFPGLFANNTGNTVDRRGVPIENATV